MHAMRMGPGKHLKGLKLMNGLVKAEDFDYFHEVCSARGIRQCFCLFSSHSSLLLKSLYDPHYVVTAMVSHAYNYSSRDSIYCFHRFVGR